VNDLARRSDARMVVTLTYDIIVYNLYCHTLPMDGETRGYPFTRRLVTDFSKTHTTNITKRGEH